MRLNRTHRVALAAAAALAASGAAASGITADWAVQTAGEATGLAALCPGLAIDEDSRDALLAVAGETPLSAEARLSAIKERVWQQAMAIGNEKACQIALVGFGPHGIAVPGLLIEIP